MSEDKPPTHGGARPGSGRKPGVGAFKGGRPISTRRLRLDQSALVTMPGGDLGEVWSITGIQSRMIEWTITQSDRPRRVGSVVKMVI